jgi:hypothetical protein
MLLEHENFAARPGQGAADREPYDACANDGAIYLLGHPLPFRGSSRR